MADYPTESDIFALLAKRRRRSALRILRESSTTLTAIELSHRIAMREHERPTTDEIRAIHLTLYHNHLPRLHEAGVLEFDPVQGTVSPGEHYGTLIDFLEEVTVEDLPWSGNYRLRSPRDHR